MSAPRQPAYPPAPVAANAVDLMGLPVHGGGAEAIKTYMTGVVSRGQQAIIPYLNVYGANLAHQTPWLAEFYRQSQFVICDGEGVRWGLAMLGLPTPTKVTYNIWLWDLCAWCRENRLSVYLLGGKPGVAERARIQILARLPGLEIRGLHHGYFDKTGPENDHVIADIERLRPDLLLLCLGMPIQERWLRDHARALPVRLLLCGGAALDYAAGEVAVCPRWMYRLHLEWLFRLWLEPVRLFRRYVFGNPQFLLRVFLYRIFHLRARREACRD